MPAPDERLPPDSAAEQLASIYAKAEQQLARLIRGSARRGAKGTEAYQRRQRSRVQRIVSALRARTPALALAATREPYEAALRATSEVLGAAPPNFAGVHERAVQAAADALADRLDESLVTVGRSARDAIRQASLEEVATGLVRGQSRKDVSSRIRARLVEQGLTAFVDKRGRRWKLSTYSELVAITTTREAVTAGTVRRLKELKHDLVKVSSHPGACDICRSFDGRTYSLSGKHPTYPKAKKLPPYHPRCKHVATPARATFEEFERELGLAT